MTKEKKLPGFYTESEVAGMIGVAIQTLRNNAAQGKGPPRTVVNRRAFYRIEAFNRWLMDQERAFDDAPAQPNAEAKS